MSPPLARYSFLPWTRRGIAARISGADSLGAPGPATSVRAVVPLALHVNDGPPQGRTVSLYGPGDVLALDARAVVRTDPRAGVTDFEPNYLPLVELYDEDLPWRHTPAGATDSHRLRPWIALVVLADGELVRDARVAGRLASIRVARAADLFPAPQQIWAWAHVHVNADLGGDPARLDAVVKADPDRALARLVAPRRLRPNTGYTAFVIPTFESGRLAGLGLDLPHDLDGSAPAWGAGQDRFPVYYEWSFRTGAAGDFEALVRLLEPRVLDPRVGQRDLDVQAPAPGLIAGITRPPVLGLEGALRSLQMVRTDWPRAGERFPDALAALIDAAAPPAGDPRVTPPLYGQWHAAVPKLSAAGVPPWIAQLNRDPRERTAAGFGAEVIRREQESLMDSAWRQIGAILEANRRLVAAQLARAVLSSLHGRHLASQPDERLLALTAPVHGRIVASAVTVREQVAKSLLPSAAVDRAFRRLTRPAGPLGRRFLGAGAAGLRLATRIGSGELTAAPPRPVPTHAILFDSVAGAMDGLTPGAVPVAKLREIDLDPAVVRAIPSRPLFHVTVPGGPVKDPGKGAADSTDAVRLRAALIALHTRIGRPVPTPPTPPALPVASLRSTLIGALDPRRTVAARVLARLRSGVDLGGRPDPLATVMAAPTFDQPMYRSLAAVGADALLPNLELVAQNTVALLSTNNRFIESYLVGLNHEMARELLWREFPTDQRGTYFRRFWDSRDSLAANAPPDIDPIPIWPRAANLGDHVRGGVDRLVLVIRGDLLKKYPTAVISAVSATWPVGGGKRALGITEKTPLFHAELEPDLVFLGFDLTAEEARGSGRPADGKPGWFFVIKQRPGEPRFGLDAADVPAATVATTWDDLSWGNLAASAAALDALERIDLDAGLEKVSIPPANNPDGAAWGATAADMAWILYQEPVLIAIHASEMIP